MVASSIAGRSRFLTVLVALVLVTSLVAAVPLAAAAPEDEPNDSRDAATSISTGTQIDGTVDPADDVDWFAFTAQKGQVINVTVTAGSGGTNNVKLKTRRTQRGGMDVSDGTGSIGTTARYTGTYYVRIGKDFFASQGTSYTLEVTTSRSDGFEPNEDRANATRIQADSTQSGDVTIGDVDWFAFDAQAGETINVTMRGGSGGTNNMKLFDRTSQRGGVDVSAGGAGSVGTTARYTGTYYLQISEDFFASQGTSYTLDVETYRTDPFEPNENLSMATPLFDNPFTPAEAQLSIGDADYFEYRLDAGETIRVEAGTPADGVEHKLRLYRPDGDDDADNRTGVEPGTIAVGELTAQSSGLHRVALVQGAFGGTGDYNVTITAAGETVGPPNDRFEAQAGAPRGNQDRANATPIEPGTYGDLGMVDDDRDVFTFRAARDARIVVNTSYDASTNDLSVEVETPDGQVQSGGDGLAFNTSAGGTHVLRVTGQAGAQATYSLRLNVTSSAPPQLPGGQGTPSDPDGDGLFEDVTGDGTFNVLDVALFLDAFGSAEVGSATVSFDFNGDGSINILDVAALLDET